MRRPCARTYSLTNASASRGTDGDTHIAPVAHRYSNRYSRANSIAVAYSDANSHAYGNSYTDSNGYTYANAAPSLVLG